MTEPVEPPEPPLIPPPSAPRGASPALVGLALVIALTALILSLLRRDGTPGEPDVPGGTASGGDPTQAEGTEGADQAALRTLGARVDTLAEGLIRLEQARDDGSDGTAISALRSAVELLETATRQQAEQIASLLTRLTRLESAVAALPTETPDPDGDPRIDGITRDVAGLSGRLTDLESRLASHVELFENHTHTVELRDLRRGWNHADPDWASDVKGLRFDTSERRLTRPLPFGDEKMIWSDAGLAAGATQKEKR